MNPLLSHPLLCHPIVGSIFIFFGIHFLAHQTHAPATSKPDPGEKVLIFPDLASFQESGKELILVLDLDATLIYYVGQVPGGGGDIPLTSFGGTEFVNIRPYVKEFLVTACDHFYCVVYTAGTQEYGGDIVAHLNKISGLELGFRNRRHCAEHMRGGEVVFHYKNLENLLPVDLIEKTIILDDTWEHYERFNNQVSNVIKIKPWKGSQHDLELTKVLKLLLHHFPKGRLSSDDLGMDHFVREINNGLDLEDLKILDRETDPEEPISQQFYDEHEL